GISRQISAPRRTLPSPSCIRSFDPQGPLIEFDFGATRAAQRGPGSQDPLVWFRAGLQQLERLLELWAHRDVQTLPARKPRHEPLLIEWKEVPVDDQLLKGSRHCIAQLRLVAAKHDAVRLIRQ